MPNKQDINKINHAEALPQVVESIAHELLGSDAEDKQQLFYLYFMFLGSIREASDLAGYSYSHARKLAKRFKSSPFIQKQIASKAEKLPGKYQTFVKLLTPRIAALDLATVKQYENNKDWLVKHPKALRDLKESSGLLAPEGAGSQTFNVDKIQILIQNCLESDTPNVAEITEAVEITRDNGDNAASAKV